MIIVNYFYPIKKQITILLTLKQCRIMKKSTFYNVMSLVLMTLMLLSCDSCKDEEEVDFTFAYICSKDLLKQVVPVISYTDENGSPQTVKLTEEIMEDSSTTNIENDGARISIKGAGNYCWQRTLHFDSFGVSREMTVTYKRRTDAEDMADNSYKFDHALICNIFVESEKVHVNDIETTLSLGVTLGGTAAQQYIQKLLTQKDYRKVAVDNGGKTTREK